MAINLNQKKNELLNSLVERGIWLAVLIGLVPALLTFYLAYAFVLQGTYAGLDKKRGQIEQKRKQVAEGRAVEAQEASFKQEFARIVGLFEDSQPMIPVENGTSDILGYLQELGSRRNVKVTSLMATTNAVKSANAEKLYERELPVSVVGNYDDVLRFWLDISKLERILVVRDFTVQPAKPGENRGAARPKSVNANFSLLAFYAPPTSEFPIIPAELKTARPAIAQK